MKVKRGKIIEATRDELFNYYLSRELYDIYSFPDYVELMKKAGTKINILSTKNNKWQRR
ncbi:hypothetical protein JGH11_17025 [Dysgonomonas sp. Marseille-P4677]|uniref:hypothetical protein n=1 Tax=Dysgonomonas sp. Marseille-P4677 TaxID=2364790 RepID=UPI0019136977|nr:hypothetical protein [Dysgonomonas sp. Marseille-P4677]MBK5722579.1 hypothetical protein [Dysgonomonas sp. Marseille-P4677]